MILKGSASSGEKEILLPSVFKMCFVLGKYF